MRRSVSAGSLEDRSGDVSRFGDHRTSASLRHVIVVCCSVKASNNAMQSGKYSGSPCENPTSRSLNDFWAKASRRLELSSFESGRPG